MKGKRIEDNKYCENNGEYSKQTDTKPYGKEYWNCKTPNGYYGCLVRHEITEHEDGTITVAPSILVSMMDEDKKNKKKLWHGYLEKGIWRSC